MEARPLSGFYHINAFLPSKLPSFRVIRALITSQPTFENVYSHIFLLLFEYHFFLQSCNVLTCAMFFFVTGAICSSVRMKKSHTIPIMYRSFSVQMFELYK